LSAAITMPCELSPVAVELGVLTAGVPEAAGLPPPPPQLASAANAKATSHFAAREPAAREGVFVMGLT
jgi:hypothetical protein